MEFKSISQLKSLLDENKISVKEIAETYIKKINEKKSLYYIEILLPLD